MRKYESVVARARGPVAVLALLALWSCSGSDGGTTQPETPRATTLAVSPSTSTLTFIGATASLQASIRDQNGAPLTGTIVTWISDAPSVATVNGSGQVTAVANGTTTVRATSGSASGSAAITVQQAVATLALVSGDAQSAIAGAALAEAVTVRAQDQGGAAVAGVTVTFTPDAGSGTVSVSSATTGADGRASTVWTMGSAFGPQKLTAAAGTVTRILSATSQSPVPLADLVASGTLQMTRPDPSTLDTVQVQATVRNDGNAGSGQAVVARLTLDGTEIATKSLGTLAAGAQQTVTFTVGPFAAGSHQLVFELDPAKAIEELNEANNTLTLSAPVALQTVISLGTTSGVGAPKDTELLYRVDLPAGGKNLTVELSGGTGDVDLFVMPGTRPSDRDGYTACQSGSPTTVERCQVSPASAGSYHILLHAFSTFSGTTMKIFLDGESLPYNIEVVFINHGSSSQEAAVTAAATQWMSLITTDVTDSDFSVQPLEANACVQGMPAVSDIVDDIRIYVSIDSIDGPSNVLGQAGPCVTRGLGNLPILGYMQFDSADLATLDQRGELLPVVLHEMGHVLGFGTIWPASPYIHNPSLPSSSGVDTYFDGPGAVAAFNAAGGTGYTKGQKVPVENSANEGSADSHWRESALGRELMTPFFNSGFTNPLSAITVRSLADLGYQVDASRAEAFSVPLSAPSPTAGVASRILDLSGDVPNRPIVVVDQKGRVIAIRR